MSSIQIIPCPYDSGRKHWRCGNGPTAILEQGAVQELQNMGASVEVFEIEPQLHYESENSMGFEIQRRIAAAVEAAAAAGKLPLVIAGNCNTAVGGISGIGGGHKRGHLWFDAHGDFCTPETTDSGFLDGMGLAMLVGRCWQQALSHMPGYEAVAETSTALIGARDLDPLETRDLEDSEVSLIRVETIRNSGVDAALGPFLDNLEPIVDRLYIHVDLDVLDPVETPANQLNVPNGLWVDEVCDAIRLAGSKCHIVGAGLGSYDPSVDPGGNTARAAIKILQTLFAVHRDFIDHEGM